MDGLAFLSQTATGFVGLGLDEDICAYIAQRLAELIDESFIAVASFDEKMQSLHIVAVAG